ncbi:nicotinate-nucleotide--dimethylbenzimidazole phosphoribosyltransferase [uncultured Chloroflexus sp.]|uniref:nicotinate-nucleotide--dimethylbenzimidazole phosphoribosyltransferase n=1 Tax=uncultured Chloroflexus sp. TaxID=214040 RepID=UPI002612078C|nr:nicotinate-nucleotide--dimethylbenzimidazole phosphoribosyltransferase [uncultured Chloroflexus sp.]
MTLLTDTINHIGPLDDQAAAAARRRQDTLTKPAGSLGRLEELSIRIAGITGRERPRLTKPAVIVMAADHGVARQGVSAFPTEVTPQMVLNFLRGGAAINVLARHVGAQVIVVDIGVAADLPSHPELVSRKLAYGTADFSQEPAMSLELARQAIEVGITCANEAIDNGVDLLATGEMGIANTTAASAVVAAITERPAAEVTGRGTGIDDTALARKIAVIEQALALHRPNPRDGLDVLAKVGGLEIGGLAGVILGAAARRVPVVIDGFIAGSAALIAATIAPAATSYMIAGHRSVERGHAAVFSHLDLQPLLDLNMRLGEGTGAVLAMSICQAACKVLDEMATFAEAGVSEKQ